MKEKNKSTQVSGCRQCKRGLNTTQKLLIVSGTFILLTSIYGTIKLIQDILTLF
jgi:hypothetical protein